MALGQPDVLATVYGCVEDTGSLPLSERLPLQTWPMLTEWCNSQHVQVVKRYPHIQRQATTAA